ncbi:DNA-processing protein DprA [Brevibacillus humidisoli]|uniref:DNA-processing protein DprA n=1 Tax=Brevibacillus humidisoli TaxID=2895522 RepID=UPI001E3F20D9|nr:DNA-processing protein DprA [Brevibacillus humidisoli]UFJ42114.1 DNA-processing protein DprA [Brevibacillus humidisoli]
MMRDIGTARLEDRDILYSLALIQGVGRKTLYQLYQRFGSYFFLFESSAGERLSSMRLSNAVQKAIVQTINRQRVLADKQQRAGSDFSFVCFLDEQFPPLLKEIPDPPAVLFYRGNFDLLSRPMIGVVGTRRPTPYGRAACRYLTTDLVQAGFVIVSGLAQGIDTEAHRAALESNGGTVAVLGCGIEQVYPRQNRSLYRNIAQSGLLVSEYAPMELPKPGLFPERNRLISAFSMGVLIVEAAERSGSLITADCALEQGKEVFAVPGPIFSSVSTGPHNLIKQGAKLITNLDDIIEELSPYVSTEPVLPSSTPALDAGERQLLSLVGYDPIHWEELFEQLDHTARSTLDCTLLHLESKGIIAALPGGYYVKQKEA